MQKDIDRITRAARALSRTLENTSADTAREVDRAIVDDDPAALLPEESISPAACAQDAGQQARLRRTQAEEELALLEKKTRAILKPDKDAG